MYVVAGMPGLQWFIIAMAAPTIIVLLFLSFTLGRTSRQRLTNLLAGFLS